MSITIHSTTCIFSHKQSISNIMKNSHPTQVFFILTLPYTYFSTFFMFHIFMHFSLKQLCVCVYILVVTHICLIYFLLQIFIKFSFGYLLNQSLLFIINSSTILGCCSFFNRLMKTLKWFFKRRIPVKALKAFMLNFCF